MSEEIKDQSLNSSDEQATTCPNGQLYTVQSGDTMFAIARRNNVCLQRLIAANPQISDPNTIAPGQVICIPEPGPGISCPGGQIYRVEIGDTMFEIASRYGVPLEALLKANPQISDPNEIFPGQEICIPGEAIPCPGGMLYTVRPGETLFEIARIYNISLAALIAANPQISDPDQIVPGQVLCIPAPMPAPRPAPRPAPAPRPTPGPAPRPAPGPAPRPTPGPAPGPRPTPGPTPAPRPTPSPTPGPMPSPAPRTISTPAPISDPMVMNPYQSYGQMPIYIVVPWEECPYRPKSKRDCRRHCR